MEHRIETLSPKKLVGISMEMSFLDNKTQLLWRTFMPRRFEVKNRLNDDYISMQVYGDDQDPFSPVTIFTKWAVVEVDDFTDPPAGMSAYTLNAGKYAVFIHHGPASAFGKTMHYIHGVWMPKSGYELDNRESFEILPAGYNPTDPNATEEIWVPIIKLS